MAGEVTDPLALVFDEFFFQVLGDLLKEDIALFFFEHIGTMADPGLEEWFIVRYEPRRF